MKKTASLILSILIVLLSVSSVCALDNNGISNDMFIYNYYEKYDVPAIYYEKYYHNTDPDNDKSNIDWVFVNCATDIGEDPSASEYATYAIVDNMMIYVAYYYEPFRTGYAIYDVDKNEYTDLLDVDVASYSGLKEYLYSSDIGRPIGDVDVDMKLTIMDATEIQRALAKIIEFGDEDNVRYRYNWIDDKSITFISDFNRDDERSVLDATAIQLELAKKSSN